ncbi:replication initiation protein, partial [Streptomyces sp. NPDC002138]|uniref:replication initiation protein n=1 Tax=Streptomyces sp. NPDC002138 TaxID=3154410 RepID=UPI00331D8B5A
MYNLQKIDPSNWQDSPVLADYIENLPHHPYCTDDKGFCHIRSKSHAIKHAYIQPNQVARVSYIIIDIDHADGIHQCLIDADLPPPHLIIQNPKNAHVHLVYRLVSPVFTWGKAKSAPIRYLARIERGLVRALGADAGYGGNLMKNPIHRSWTTYTTTAPKEGYTLEYLAQFVELDDMPDAANDSGFGRNCSLFDSVRHHGYKAAPATYRALVEHLEPIATELNNRFDKPLFQNEVMHIVRSIARYCSKTDFTASRKAFSELQSARSMKRWGDSTEQQKQALELYIQGMKKTEISKQLGVNVSTLTRWGLRKKSN